MNDHTFPIVTLITLAAAQLALLLGAAATSATEPTLKEEGHSNARPRFWQEIPSAAFKFKMVLVPGDEEIRPFWIGATELTWEAFDVFVYRLDVPAEDADDADAVSRPTKPYLPPDRGFGHDGYAAISMSFHSAQEFCRWLSHKTGRRYRLPTEREWQHAALAGSAGPYGFGADVARLGDYAWFADNSNGTPHPVGRKKPNAWGLYDMHGNVAEWCTSIDADAEPVTCGGSYRDSARAVTARSRARLDPSWNASDPQIPKSQWWLADAPFVGFRVVCEYDEPDNAKAVNDEE